MSAEADPLFAAPETLNERDDSLMAQRDQPTAVLGEHVQQFSALSEGGTEPYQGLRELGVGLLIANAIAAACYGPRGELRVKGQGQLKGTR